MSNIVGSINNELNIIRAKYRETGECSESYIKYYNQIEQPTHVKAILSEQIVPFDNYFGGYADRLNDPLVYWNGFYLQPYRITHLADLIATNRIIHNDKFITDINEISEYIFAYKEGFALGYEKFDSIEIENKSSVFKSDKLSIEKIINYIENHKESDNGGFIFQCYPKTNFEDHYSSDGLLKPKVDKIPFSTEECKERQLKGICSERMLHAQQTGNECHACFPFILPVLNRWKSNGFEGGKYYRAWFIVLANYQIFDEYYKSKMIPALNEPGTALPTEKSIKKRKGKITQPFQNHLRHNEPGKLAEICKSIFNRNSSKKDYSIMLCLLSEHGLILTPNLKRSDFYLSWYGLINEQLPKNNNFYGINKHIVDKSVSGFVFHDEADQDYCHLKSTFEEALKSIK